MCLITKQTEPFIASKNITVYKVVEHNRLPIYRSGTKYLEGETYTTEIKESLRVSAYGSQVLERYNLPMTSPHFENSIKEQGLKAYGQGFHILMTKKRGIIEGENGRYTVLKCTIPKGTKYYIDETGLGITEKLIVVGEI